MRYLLLVALVLPVSASAQFTASPGSSPQAATPLSTIAVPSMSYGPRTTAPISGSDYGLRHDVLVPEGAWVYGIHMGELGDRPCHLVLRYATIENDEVSVGSRSASTCIWASRRNRGNLTRVRRQRAAVQSTSTSVGFNYRTRDESFDPELIDMLDVFGLAADGIDNLFDNSIPRRPMPFLDEADNPLVGLKGLKLCQRRSNNRMKGLAVRGVTLRHDGANDRFNTRPIRANGRWVEPSFERTNCNDWSRMRVCPSGQVMVGVRVEGRVIGDDESGSISVKGLAPICARLLVED